MPKRYSTRDIERILIAHGFSKTSQRGSHVKYTMGAFVVIVPAGRKEVRPGTLASIIRQSGLSSQEFSGD